LSQESRDADGKVWHFRKSAPAVTDDGARTPVRQASLPSWLMTRAPSSPAAPVILRPSDMDDDEPASFIGGGGSEVARLRGTLAHRLLQSLPDIPADRRRKAADDYLARNASKLPVEERVKLAQQLILVLDDERFRELFATGSRAEVPIVGQLTFGRRTVSVSGQVDRLSVTPAGVLIGDFKTSRPPPRRIEQVPRSYVRQLAAYRGVLKKLYPDMPIRCALVWTEAPDLMEFSSAVLDQALADHVAAIAP
jgi:ATP-dependent helicase/nuclease subunit A